MNTLLRSGGFLPMVSLGSVFFLVEHGSYMPPFPSRCEIEKAIYYRMWHQGTPIRLVIYSLMATIIKCVLISAKVAYHLLSYTAMSASLPLIFFSNWGLIQAEIVTLSARASASRTSMIDSRSNINGWLASLNKLSRGRYSLAVAGVDVTDHSAFIQDL